MIDTNYLLNFLGPLIYPPIIWAIFLGGIAGLLSTHFVNSQKQANKKRARIFPEVITDNPLWTFASGAFGSITLIAIAMWLTNIDLDPVFENECGTTGCKKNYEAMKAWFILSSISAIGGLASVKVLSSIVDGVTKTLDKKVSELTNQVEALRVDDVKIHEELVHITAANLRVRAAQLLRDDSYSAAYKTYLKSINIEPTAEGYAGVASSLSYMNRDDEAYEYSCKSLKLLVKEISSDAPKLTEFEQGVIHYNHACIMHLHHRESCQPESYVDEVIKYLKLSLELSKEQLIEVLLEDSGIQKEEDKKAPETDFIDLMANSPKFSTYIESVKANQNN